MRVRKAFSIRTVRIMTSSLTLLALRQPMRFIFRYENLDRAAAERAPCVQVIIAAAVVNREYRREKVAFSNDRNYAR